MNKLVVKKDGLVVEGFNLTSNSLVPNGKPSFEIWEDAGKLLKSVEGSVMWWLGDWLNYGECAYGEKYSQALEATDYEYQTLKAAVWVANKVEMVRRRTILSWSHHREVSGLPPSEQEKWLGKAVKNEWSVHQLRHEIKEDKDSRKELNLDDRKPVSYGDNMFYTSAKWFDRKSDFPIIKEGEPYPTLKRRSWFYHPDGREFTLREYADVQEFPKSFKFVGTYEKIKDQIGNAVSPTMAKHVGGSLKGKTFGDLFAGAGGLSCGLELLDKKAKWAIERNVDYARTYKFNHHETKVVTRDIRQLKPSDFEEVDIIVGGPPCQGFSLSGSRFKDDSRNLLYREFVRFVKELRPKEFLMENVPQVSIFEEEIKKDFEELGYNVETMLIKGEDIGMRQKRHRFFFIGRQNGND